jgi:hypothetical protein
MPGKEMESAKSGNWPTKWQRGNPNKKQGSELWGSCANRVVPLHQTAGIRVSEKVAESSADVPPALPLGVGERLGSQN